MVRDADGSSPTADGAADRRLVIISKPVFWHNTVAFAVHDTRNIKMVATALRSLSKTDVRQADISTLGVLDLVLVASSKTWYRACIEKIHGDFVSVTKIDIGDFVEKVPVDQLYDISVVEESLGGVPGVEICFVQQFEPERFASDVIEWELHPRFPAILKENLWRETIVTPWTEQKTGTPVVSLKNREGQDFSEILRKNLRQKSVGLCKPSEMVSVEFADDDALSVSITRHSGPELRLLEYELENAARKDLLEKVEDLEVDDYVAAEWNSQVLRGVVTHKTPDNSKIFLLDRGIETNSALGTQWKLPEEYVGRLPFCGLHVELLIPPTRKVTKTIRLDHLKMLDGRRASAVIGEYFDDEDGEAIPISSVSPTVNGSKIEENGSTMQSPMSSTMPSAQSEEADTSEISGSSDEKQIEEKGTTSTAIQEEVKPSDPLTPIVDCEGDSIDSGHSTNSELVQEEQQASDECDSDQDRQVSSEVVPVEAPIQAEPMAQPDLLDSSEQPLQNGGGDIIPEQSPQILDDGDALDVIEVEILSLFSQTEFRAIWLSNREAIRDMIDSNGEMKELRIVDLTIDKLVLVLLNKEFVRGLVTALYRDRVTVELIDDGSFIDVPTVYECPRSVGEFEASVLKIHLGEWTSKLLLKNSRIKFQRHGTEGDTLYGVVVN